MRSKKNTAQPYPSHQQSEVAAYQHEDRLRDNMFGSFGMPSFASHSKHMDDIISSNFGGHPFGSVFQDMDQMMNHMNKGIEDHFKAVNDHFNDVQHGKAPGHIEKHVYMSKQVIGQNGKPVVEKYENNSYVTSDANGKKIGERQQYYQNTAIDYEKAAHERMLGNQGRKIVKERQHDNHNSYDYYRNMESNEGQQFDQKWGQAKEELKFNTPASNYALPYGCDYGGHIEDERPHHYQKPQSNHDSHPIQNEASRKFEMDDKYKDESSPVRVKNAIANDIAPTQGNYKPIVRKPIANNKKEAFPVTKAVVRKH